MPKVNGFQFISGKAAFPTDAAITTTKRDVLPRRARHMFTPTLTLLKQIEKPRKMTCSPVTQMRMRQTDAT
jgi:hypothetical protein